MSIMYSHRYSLAKFAFQFSTVSTILCLYRVVCDSQFQQQYQVLPTNRITLSQHNCFAPHFQKRKQTSNKESVNILNSNFEVNFARKK